MRRALAALLGASTLLLAGCGYEGTVAPTAKDVSGTVPQQKSTLPKGDPAAGKKLFASNGCTGCHTYAPAGSSGKVGPDLDHLPADAQKAGKPLDAFIHESIVDPNAFVAPGYPRGVMPTNYGKTLSKAQLDTLVKYLGQQAK
jgi:mono/diheme cytochrome c family protein